jgi:Tfp pilus assembly protein PilZ
MTDDSASVATATCQRRGERFRTRLPVSYGPGDFDCESFAESISPGGLHIHTNEVFKVGTRLVMRVEFPEKTVCLQGEVTWAIRVPDQLQETMVCGMGISFIDPSPEWQALFERWKESLTVAAR